MKKILQLLIFIVPIFSSYSQNLIASDGCVRMYGDASITNNGATWNAFIENNCSDYVKVGESVFKVRLEKTKSDGKKSTSTKKIKFPSAFMRPNSVLAKDRKGSDGSAFYSDVKSIDGELGSLQSPFNGRPKNYENALQLVVNEPIELGNYGAVKVFATLKKTVFDGWENFDKYKVEIRFENSSTEKLKEEIYVNYELCMSGIVYSGSERISKIKGNDYKTASDKIDAIFNYTPDIFINILATNITKTTQLTGE